MHRLKILTPNMSKVTKSFVTSLPKKEIKPESTKLIDDSHAYLKTYYNNLQDDSPYIRDTEKQLASAKAYVTTRVLTRQPEAKFAVTFDIDDTSISHYPNFLAENFENSLLQIDQRIRKTDNPAIKPILNFYQWLIEKNINIFFISYRVSHIENPQKDLAPCTHEGLLKAGYQFIQASHIFLPLGEDTQLKSVDFKTKVRKKLTDQGYQIILNIGDQPSDLGEYAELNTLLPNKLYGPDSVLGLKPVIAPEKDAKSIPNQMWQPAKFSEPAKLHTQGIFKLYTPQEESASLPEVVVGIRCGTN